MDNLNKEITPVIASIYVDRPRQISREPFRQGVVELFSQKVEQHINDMRDRTDIHKYQSFLADAMVLFCHGAKYNMLEKFDKEALILKLSCSWPTTLLQTIYEYQDYVRTHGSDAPPKESAAVTANLSTLKLSNIREEQMAQSVAPNEASKEAPREALITQESSDKVISKPTEKIQCSEAELPISEEFSEESPEELLPRHSRICPPCLHDFRTYGLAKSVAIASAKNAKEHDIMNIHKEECFPVEGDLEEIEIRVRHLMQPAIRCLLGKVPMRIRKYIEDEDFCQYVAMCAIISYESPDITISQKCRRGTRETDPVSFVLELVNSVAEYYDKFLGIDASAVSLTGNNFSLAFEIYCDHWPEELEALVPRLYPLFYHVKSCRESLENSPEMADS